MNPEKGREVARTDAAMLLRAVIAKQVICVTGGVAWAGWLCQSTPAPRHSQNSYHSG